MAEVTVSELANSVGAPVERLLKQMQEAGLSQKTATALVSDDEKQKLLAYLKTSHGESTAEPRKITLQRKTTTTLKTGSGSARKIVNVEVRKKRTYVKRDDADQAEPELEETELLENQTDVPEVPVEIPADDVAKDIPVAAEASVATDDGAVTPMRTSFTDGIEEKRRAAQERRMAEEAQRKQDLQNKEDSKHQEQRSE